MPLSQKLTQAAPQMLPEAPAHHDAVERVLDRAFGPGRFAKPSERVREFARFRPDLSRVAVSGPVMLGCCRIYEIGIGDQTALFLGPLGVAGVMWLFTILYLVSAVLTLFLTVPEEIGQPGGN